MNNQLRDLLSETINLAENLNERLDAQYAAGNRDSDTPLRAAAILDNLRKAQRLLEELDA